MPDVIALLLHRSPALLCDRLCVIVSIFFLSGPMLLLDMMNYYDELSKEGVRRCILTCFCAANIMAMGSCHCINIFDIPLSINGSQNRN